MNKMDKVVKLEVRYTFHYEDGEHDGKPIKKQFHCSIYKTNDEPASFNADLGLVASVKNLELITGFIQEAAKDYKINHNEVLR